MSTLGALARHWRILKIHGIEVVHFPLRALVWFVVGSMNTVIILLFWWASLQAASPGVFPDSLPQLTSYYILLLTFSTISMCHLEEDISHRDIQKGNLYQYLLRPYPYILSKFHEEVVWRLLGAFWALLLLLVLLVLGLQLTIAQSPLLWALAALSLVLGMLCSFFLKVCLGLLSIWLTNIRGIMDLYTILEIVFAGFVIPLILLPDGLRQFALLSPFSTYVYFPVQIFTGQMNLEQIPSVFGIQILWILVFFVLSQFMFTRGVRHYTGVSQ